MAAETTEPPSLEDGRLAATTTEPDTEPEPSSCSLGNSRLLAHTMDLDLPSLDDSEDMLVEKAIVQQIVVACNDMKFPFDNADRIPFEKRALMDLARGVGDVAYGLHCHLTYQIVLADEACYYSQVDEGACKRSARHENERIRLRR